MAEKPEDLNLPTAVITRMIKEVLPDGVNISKEARAAISKSASVFVLYATSCANNIALQHKRKTLTATDVLDAIEEMEFTTFLKPLKEALEIFKREQKEKKDAAEIKKKQKEQKMEPLTNGVGETNGEALEGGNTEEGKAEEEGENMETIDADETEKGDQNENAIVDSAQPEPMVVA